MKSYAEITLAEFDHEMASTRKVLERVPDDKFDWRAAPGLNTIGWNANHLAEIPGWVEGTLTQDSWNANPPGGPPYKSPDFKSTKEVLQSFDEQVAIARKAISAVKEDQLDVMWSLLSGDQVIFTAPRRDVIRSFVLNHAIHHRAHLIVYLRLNGITLPGMYGPGGE